MMTVKDLSSLRRGDRVYYYMGAKGDPIKWQLGLFLYSILLSDGETFSCAVCSDLNANVWNLCLEPFSLITSLRRYQLKLPPSRVLMERANDRRGGA
jgi:hypothetical protein